ncbi:MAG: hypothetical protein ACRDVK_09290 [Acidimicrobiia bacterium]
MSRGLSEVVGVLCSGLAALLDQRLGERIPAMTSGPGISWHTDALAHPAPALVAIMSDPLLV